MGEQDHHHHNHGHGDHGAGDGIEWKDYMVDMNRLRTSSNTRLQLVDADSGRERRDRLAVRVGDQIKIQLRSALAGDPRCTTRST